MTILCVLPLLVAGGLLLFAGSPDSDRFRTLLVERVNRQVRGRIDVARIGFEWGGRIVLYDISVFAPEGFERTLPLHIDLVDIAWWPLSLLSRTVDIREFRVVNPELDLEQREDGRLNLAEALGPKEPAAEDAVPPPAGKLLLETGPEGTRLNLPELPVAVRLGALTLSDLDIGIHASGFALKAGPANLETSGSLADGRLHLYQTAGFGPERKEGGLAAVSIRGQAGGLDTKLGGRIQLQADSGRLEASTLRVNLELTETAVTRPDGSVLNPGDTKLELDSGEDAGTYTLALRQADYAETTAEFLMRAYRPRLEAEVSANGSADLDRTLAILATRKDRPQTQHGKLEFSLSKSPVTFAEGTASGVLESLDLTLKADRIAANGATLAAPSAALTVRKLGWEAVPSGGVRLSAPEPVRLSAEAGFLRSGAVRADGLRLRAEAKPAAETTGFAMKAELTDIEVWKPGASEPVLSGSPVLTAAGTLDPGAKTVRLDSAELSAPDLLVFVQDVFRVLVPFTASLNGFYNYGSGKTSVAVQKLTAGNWARMTLSSEAELNRKDRPFQVSSSASVSLTKLAHAIEPLREGLNFQPLAGDFKADASASGALEPLSADFQLKAALHAFTEEPMKGITAESVDVNAGFDGRFEKAAGLSRLVGVAKLKAAGIEAAGHRIAEATVNLLMKPEQRPELVRAALEVQTHGVVVETLGSEPVPDLSLWLRCLADFRRQTVREIVMPFSLKDTVSGRLGGELDLKPAVRGGLRLVIEPVSLADLVRKLPENTRQSLLRLRPGGRLSADLTFKGPLPGPDVLVTGDFPVRVGGGIRLSEASLTAGDITAQGIQSTLDFNSKERAQAVTLDITAGEIRSRRVPAPLYKTTAGFAAVFENLNRIGLETMTLRVPGAGFRLEGTGEAEGLFSNPKGSLRANWALDARTAARLTGTGIEAGGQAEGDLFVNVISRNEADIFGGIRLDRIGMTQGKSLEMQDLSGPIGIQIKAKLNGKQLELLPVKAAGNAPEAESLLERRLRSQGQEQKPIRLSSLRWKTARMERFSGWASVEGGEFRMRSMEAKALEGGLVADLTARFFPAPEVWVEGTLSRLDTSTLMKHSPGGDYVVNQNFNVRTDRGGDFSARINITRIGKEAMDGLLDLLDPTQGDPKFKRLRELLGWGLVPELVAIEADHGYLTLTVSLKSRIVWDAGYFFQSALVSLLEPWVGRTLVELDQRIPRIPVSTLLDNLKTRKVAAQ